MKQRIINILFWSVISAAFIGPGTVTTAASAGAGFGYALIWALIFSTVACYILQEASARITAVSGLNLGQAMKQEYGSSRAGNWLIWLALIAILSGCAAFEAGNILGAVAGLTLVTGSVPVPLIVAVIGITAGILLWNGTVRQIAKLLGVIVAIMGICFVITAVMITPSLSEIFANGFIPTIPDGSEILVLGLIGTTVVPYNIFLGSGLKHAQSPAEMKLSLGIAIGLGGLISVAILLTGTAISGDFSFEKLASTLSQQLGGYGSLLLATGLFGAGLSSTLTAALAASITAKSLLSDTKTPSSWSERGIKFRSVWMGVLGIGLLFGVMELRPIPVIILAQALNGIILPVIAVILFLLMNNGRILPKAHQNRTVQNLLTGIVVWLSILLGLTNLLLALSGVFEFTVPGQTTLTLISGILFLAVIVPLVRRRVWLN
ncbi:NRAMP family divalent metal transporter [Rhodohalobacter sp. 8-1]|uniref:NRAMP family divalent metal transporter n=1 Tax=Rhodohalobacter sp. 8-1 TaxID=3131972 RepID=UPI0030EEB6B3